MPLSSEELQFYSRQLKLPQFGEVEQLRLKKAKVLCIGAGGLGAPLLRYLAGAGVGHLGVIDFDSVEASNLHRQSLYDLADIGKNKAITAAEKLARVNPFITITAYPERFDYSHGLQLAKEYDLLIDGTDNFAARYATNQIAIALDKAFLFAAVQEFYGQLALLKPKDHVCFRCLFPAPPPPELAANCAQNGILGTIPGILGLMQAQLAILYLSGLYIGQFNELLSYDLLSFEVHKHFMEKNRACPSCSAEAPKEHIDAFLQKLQQQECALDFEGISPQDLANLLEGTPQSVSYVLIDVREPEEHALGHLGGQLIPLATLPNYLPLLPHTQRIIVYCQKGIRSKRAKDFLSEQGFQLVEHLTGGIDAWQKAGLPLVRG